MQRNTEWMMSMIPTMLGAIILAVALMSSAPFLIKGMLRTMSLQSTVTNLLKNSVDFMKYISGVGK